MVYTSKLILHSLRNLAESDSLHKKTLNLFGHLFGRAATLNILHNILVKVTTLGVLASKGSGGLPLGRCAGRGFLHHLVDLLKRQALGLGHNEVGVNEGTGAESAPDEEDLGLQVTLVSANHVGCNDGNNRVPQPVGGGGQTNTTGTNGKREDFTNDDPSAWAPSRSKPEDENGNERDLSIDGSLVLGDGRVLAGIRARVRVRDGMVKASSNTNNGDDELAHQHAESTNQQNRAAAESFDRPERDGGGKDVDDGKDHGGQEDVGNGLGRLEEGGREVEDEVDASPLLHHLQRGAQNSAAQVGLGVPKTALEAVGPATNPGSLGDKCALILFVGDDLGDLTLYIFRVLGLATDTSNGIDGLLNHALLNIVSG